MSLLTIIQAVCDRTGLARPTVVVTSTDAQVRQLYALANEEGEELAKRCFWQALTAQWTFITVAQPEQTNSPIPPDLDRFIPNSFFDRTQVRELIGPITPQEWQQVQTFPAYASPFLAFREREGDFLMTPTPAAGDTVAYEYVSAYWAKSSAGNAKAEFTSDDDGTYLSEQLIIQGVRWRWKQAKGLDYAEDMATYERNVSRAIAKDGGARRLSITGRQNTPILTLNIPEQGYGLPS